MSLRKTKPKTKITLAASASGGIKTHDRRSTDLTINSVVAPILVEDPYDNEGGKVVVLRSLRDDPLAAMHNANQLDDAQFMAGRHWQRNRDLLEIGGAKAIDPGKEAVDGGPVPGQFHISNARLAAFEEMTKAIEALGLEGNGLMKMFLDQGLTLRVISDRWGARTARERGYVGYRLRECLDTLAVHFGYARNMFHRNPQDVVREA